MKASGFTYREIGRVYGVTGQRIQQILRPPNFRRLSRSGLCRDCGRFSKTLNVHHVDYLRDGYRLLCAQCHRKAHPASPQFKSRQGLTPLVHELRAWRRHWRLTQLQAAASLGVPVSTFIKWEQGTRRPRGLALELLNTKLQNPPEI